MTTPKLYRLNDGRYMITKNNKSEIFESKNLHINLMLAKIDTPSQSLVLWEIENTPEKNYWEFGMFGTLIYSQYKQNIFLKIGDSDGYDQ